jgi:hypothetical protein
MKGVKTMRLVEQQHVVPAVWPVDFNTAANPGDYVSMKNYKHLTVVIMQNTAGGTAAVTMLQASAVAGTGEKALSFSEYFMTGAKWKFTGKSATDFQVGETVTGAGGASGVVSEIGADYLLVYTVNATAVVDGETLTGGTSGATATADGAGVDEDILLKCSASSNTFTIPAVANRMYVIEIDASSLDLDNDFDCVRVNIAQATGAGIGSALYVLSEPRYQGVPMESAIYD